MTFIDFFAGIGGFHMGLELAGHKCIGYCEFDKFASASYRSMHTITEEQRAYLATLDLKTRQKEIQKDEYLNGIWFSNDIRTVDAGSLPRADCWTFGAPCQSFSVAGLRAGLAGESGLVREIFRLLREIREEDRPKWLIYENVKGMFSSNKGFDYLAILLEMDELGYDIEWQLLNSKDFGVPQNRERVFTVGHLRAYGAAKVFPIEGTNGENRVHGIGHRNGYRRNTQIFERDGITEALDTAAGGGRGHHTIEVVGHLRPDANIHDSDRVLGIKGIAPTLRARDYKEPYRLVYPLSEIQPSQGVAIPVLTPDRAVKRQNGRRFKEDGEEAFTLTGQDRHGVAVSIEDFYQGRPTRFYDNESPTLRSDRHGLKVGIPVEPEEE